MSFPSHIHMLLAWADAHAASLYDPARLSPADQLRAVARSARRDLDWRVSRTLKQRWLPAYPDAAHSLSHSNGQACLALAPAGWRVGVDIELCRPRCLETVAEWAFNDYERAWLAAQSPHHALRALHVLWTLKEALLKAADLDFPADLRGLGLTSDGSLRAPPGQWHALSFWCRGGWALSVAWSAPVRVIPAPVVTSPNAEREMLAPLLVTGGRCAVLMARQSGVCWLPVTGESEVTVLAGARWGAPDAGGGAGGKQTLSEP